MAPKRKNRVPRNSRGGRISGVGAKAGDGGNAGDGAKAGDGGNAGDGVNAGDVGAGGSGVSDSVSKDKQNLKGEFSSEGAASLSESGLKLEKDPQGPAANLNLKSDKEGFLAVNPTLQSDLEKFFRSLQVKSESEGKEKITSKSKGKEKITSNDQEESLSEGIVTGPIVVPPRSVAELELAIKQAKEELEGNKKMIDYEKAALEFAELEALKASFQLHYLQCDLDHESSCSAGGQSQADGAADDEATRNAEHDAVIEGMEWNDELRALPTLACAPIVLTA